MKQPTKAIICAAGIGTRFLPQTKAIPKEMLPIIDKPVIQIIVERIVAAGVTDIIIVTDSTKKAIEDHFDKNDALESMLRLNNKSDKADQIQKISELANFIYIRQKGTPKGNARPVLNARHLIDKDEPFFVFFADDFFKADVAWPLQLKNAYNITGKSVISMIEIDKKDADKYAIAELGEAKSDRLFKLNSLIEKPGEKNALSNFASVGGFLLTPDIFDIIAKEKVGSGGEIVLADSIAELAATDEVYGCFIDGVWHDTGNQLTYIKAVVDMALSDDLYKDELRKYLTERLDIKA
ncbi:MAG: sugar phosphate nucleotidyltransferase [Candidatus Saccharibacteria bacterium]